jgi:hypothetical protein
MEDEITDLTQLGLVDPNNHTFSLERSLKVIEQTTEFFMDYRLLIKERFKARFQNEKAPSRLEKYFKSKKNKQ